MLTLVNLSTVSGSLISAEWTCSVCGGTAAECLCYAVRTNPVMDGGDGDIGGVPTTPQFSALKLQEWIQWSQMKPIAGGDCGCGQDDCFVCAKSIRMESRMMAVINPRGCTGDDPCGSALCPYCG